jgi:hypothetical protein
MQPNPPTDEPNQGVTTCSLCGRAVLKADVNSSGRCSECAGKHADDEAEEE